MSRIGQMWWARKNMCKDEFEPCLIIGVVSNTEPADLWWVMRPLEKLGNPETAFSEYEADFCHVEAGNKHAWLKERID